MILKKASIPNAVLDDVTATRSIINVISSIAENIADKDETLDDIQNLDLTLNLDGLESPKAENLNLNPKETEEENINIKTGTKIDSDLDVLASYEKKRPEISSSMCLDLQDLDSDSDTIEEDVDISEHEKTFRVDYSQNLYPGADFYEQYKVDRLQLDNSSENSGFQEMPNPHVSQAWVDRISELTKSACGAQGIPEPPPLPPIGNVGNLDEDAQRKLDIIRDLKIGLVHLQLSASEQDISPTEELSADLSNECEQEFLVNPWVDNETNEILRYSHDAISTGNVQGDLDSEDSPEIPVKIPSPISAPKFPTPRKNSFSSKVTPVPCPIYVTGSGQSQEQNKGGQGHSQNAPLIQSIDLLDQRRSLRPTSKPHPNQLKDLGSMSQVKLSGIAEVLRKVKNDPE